MDYKEVTLEDIERMENELRHYYSMRKMFLGIGWGLIGLSIILFFLAVFIGAFIAPSNQKIIYLMSYLVSFSIVGAIAIFILRGALYNRRIKNRRELIKQAKEYRQNRQLFDE